MLLPDSRYEELTKLARTIVGNYYTHRKSTSRVYNPGGHDHRYSALVLPKGDHIAEGKQATPVCCLLSYDLKYFVQGNVRKFFYNNRNLLPQGLSGVEVSFYNLVPNNLVPELDRFYGYLIATPISRISQANVMENVWEFKIIYNANAIAALCQTQHCQEKMVAKVIMHELIHSLEHSHIYLPQNTQRATAIQENEANFGMSAIWGILVGDYSEYTRGKNGVDLGPRF